MKAIHKAVFGMVRAINLRLNATAGEDTNRQAETVRIWTSAESYAASYLRENPSARVVSELLDLMRLQDRRETGEAHLSAEAAIPLFKTGVEKAVRSQVEPLVESLLSVAESGWTEVLHLANNGLNFTNYYRAMDALNYGVSEGRGFLEAPIPVEERSLVTLLVHALERIGLDLEQGQVKRAMGDVPALQEATEGARTAAKVAAARYLGRMTEGDAEVASEKAKPHTAEGYFKQRSETLLRLVQKAGWKLSNGESPKHSQLLQFAAKAEGFNSFQALKAKFSADTPNFCPHCGAAGTLEECGTVFCEMGEYDGRSYELEGDAPQYHCSRCDNRFADWRDWTEAAKESDVKADSSVERLSPMQKAMQQLEAHYGENGEHPVYDGEYWRHELRVHDTRLENYWEWLVHQLEANQEMFPWEREENGSVQLVRAAGLKVVRGETSSWELSGPAVTNGLVDPVDGDGAEEEVWGEAAYHVVGVVLDKNQSLNPEFWATMSLDSKLMYVREVFGTDA